MKPSKRPPPTSTLKQALLGLNGIIGVSISMFGPFKVPFAEAQAKEYWRHALAGIVLLLLLFTAIISLALYMFDANYFKSQMVDYVKTKNQRDLTLEGDIKVTFFPPTWPGFRKNDAEPAQQQQGLCFHRKRTVLCRMVAAIAQTAAN